MSGKVNIITRDHWCARPSKGTEQMNTPVKFVFVHHTAMAECLTEKDCCEEVRKIQNAHMDNKGWDDIGYSFLIGEDGQVYEGRGWDRVGAHTYGWNRIAVAFSIMGNYMTRIPNQKAIEALKAIISVGISKGKIEKDYRLYGHKDVGNTKCPGIKLYELISKWPEYGPLPPVKPSA